MLGYADYDDSHVQYELTSTADVYGFCCQDLELTVNMLWVQAAT